MRKEFDDYFHNLNRIWVLAKPYCTEVDNEVQWLKLIKNNADETRMLRLQNQEILKNTVFCYLDSIETMDEETEAQLYEFAIALAEFTRQADIGLSLHIHQILLRYAEFHQDDERIIRECYYIGLHFHYMTETPNVYGMGIGNKEIRYYFERGASYMSSFNDFPSKETRGYILRCLANIKLAWPGVSYTLGTENFFHVEEIGIEERHDFNEKLISIFSDSQLRTKNSDLPWDQFLYSVHFGYTSLLTYLRMKNDPEIANAVLRSATYVYKREEMAAKNTNQTLSGRLTYIYNGARFHAGLITRYEFLDILLTAHENADPNDRSNNGIFVNLNLLNYIRRYMIDYSEPESRQLTERINRADERSWKYIRQMPLSEYLSIVTSFIRDLMSVSALYTDFKEYKKYLLDYILACHQPTYVHSLMVAFLTRELCSQMLSLHPEYFIGIFGIKDISQVQLHQNELLSFAYNCGLYHDIGKGAVLNYVSIYGRNLFDEEFRLIQIHPYLGYHTLLDFSDTKLLADVALGHHKWFDGTKGYPDFYNPDESKVKQFIDLAAVADSVDAATDNVGRSYADAKDLHTLVDEFQYDKGSRYSPQVIELFDNPDFLKHIEDSLQAERTKTYLMVYRDAQKNND